jgi:hypothetical protein
MHKAEDYIVKNYVLIVILGRCAEIELTKHISYKQFEYQIASESVR